MISKNINSAFHSDESEQISKIVIEALEKAGKRGIISGMGKLQNAQENVFAVDSIPHSWLFEKVSAVCHHCGAGTTAAIGEPVSISIH